MQVQVGNSTLKTTTGLDGSFSLTLPGGVSTFTLTVIPPAGQGIAAQTFAEVPLSAYRSPYGTASEMNIYLPAPASKILPGYPARTGTITGNVTFNNQPVASTTPRNLTQLFNPPQPCENGLVVYGGGRTVTTSPSGSYQIPISSTNNLYAASGSLWAGNYTGTDTGNCQTATEYYWAQFQLIPEVRVYLNGTSTSQNVALEAFDPQSNPRVTTLAVSHDYGALTGFNFNPTSPSWNAFSLSTASFAHAIHSGDIELGQYYFRGQTTKNLRVLALPPTDVSQQITVQSHAVRLSAAESILDYSSVQQWRDGSNLSQALTVSFLDTPKLTVNDGATLGPNPTLSWTQVSGGQVYVVSVYDQTGNLVWVGYTPKTEIALPIPLSSGTTYSWDVSTDDQTGMLEYIGMDPSALQARLYLDPAHYPRLKGYKGSTVNQARGRMAQAFLERLGYVPQGAYQNLLQRGYRQSVSETRTFLVQ
ncbi:hypothetical protein [Thermus tenuipuniceus]|uniref:hypothetical protein n=1 Tax=Thermus tenuipuniceus TaxID=2078690 RepID=UPI000CF88FB5|nr:hypothetical protein [Thermus tenuipuniceus]